MEAEVMSGNGIANVKVPATWKEDKYAWIFLGVMVLTLVAGAIMKVNLGILLLILNFAVMRSEEKLAAKDKMDWPSTWWCLIPPVYFWKRLTLLKQPRIHFWLWIGVAVGLSIILA